MLNVSLNAAITTQSFYQRTEGLSSNGRSFSQYTEVQASSIEVSISIESAPLSLAYQSAVDRINENVEPYLGEEALQRGHANGLDVSPEATAGRILDFATGLFDLFSAQRPGDELGQVISDFVEVIQGGVIQGFEEAKEILDGLGVLEGDIAVNVDATFELVIEGLEEFAAGLVPQAA